MHWAVPGPALTMKTFPPTTTPEPTRCVCFSSHSRLDAVTSPTPPSLKPKVGPLTQPENATPIPPETTGEGYTRSAIASAKPSQNHKGAPVFGSQPTTWVSMLHSI